LGKVEHFGGVAEMQDPDVNNWRQYKVCRAEGAKRRRLNSTNGTFAEIVRPLSVWRARKLAREILHELDETGWA
jgi:hypothetical protein